MDKKLIAIITLGITTGLFFVTTVVFVFMYSFAQDDFADQVEVSRLLVEGYDSLTSFEFEESEAFLEEAQSLQQEILDRNGIDQL